MTPRALALLNRAIVRARAEFESLLSEAGRGHHVDALKLQRHLNEITSRTNKITLGDLQDGKEGGK